MNILDFIKLAFFAITRNKTRAFLTMLGIIIGVGAVIAMIGIGEGSKKASIDIIQSMGSNMLTIFNGGGGSNTRMGPMGFGSVLVLKEEDANLIERELKGSSVEAATPQNRSGRTVAYQSNNTVTSIQGSGVQFLQIRGWEVQQGRFFTDQEVKGQAKVCVLGTTVRDELFPDGSDPVGKTIRVGALPFEVVGVLESKGAGMMGDQDDLVVAPYTTVMRKVQGIDHIQNILVSAKDGKADLAELEITALIRQRLRLTAKDESPFMIRKQDDWVKMQDQQASVLTTFLAMAASISLIVGGIGISNIMLVSVTERTREIGIRRALGATRQSVLLQFLTEAVVLSLLGGLLGVGIAYLIIWILQATDTLPALAEPWAVALGLGFSGVVGIVAGFLPAIKASNLDVIDALRYE
jgi:putative ABC transport system permease protein